MASIEVFVDDQRIIDHLKNTRQLDPGEAYRTVVSVEPQAPVANSTITHVVKIELHYGFELGELRGLVDI